MRDKKDVTNVMGNITEDKKERTYFLMSVEKIKYFIDTLKPILLSDKQVDQDINIILSNELDLIFKAGKSTRNYRRTLQDFYILWVLIVDVQCDRRFINMKDIKRDIKDIFKKMKNIENSELENNLGYINFVKTINEFKSKYQPKRV